MKTIKELEAEIKHRANCNVIRNKYDVKIEAECQALKDVLGLIDEEIAWQKQLIKNAHGRETIINVCECIILELISIKAKIKG